MDKEQLKPLIEKYLNGTASTEESAMVETWYNTYREETHPELTDNMITAATDRVANRLDKLNQPKKITLWSRWTAAAAVILITVGLSYYYVETIKQPNLKAEYGVDIVPGKNGATLTLANGKKILINDALSGNIAEQSGVKISKTEDGTIVYEISGEHEQSGSTGYNTLTTTRGEQSKVRLPDGSFVFLNAASSLTYPASFAKLKQRKVALTGEGYFEVAKDKAHPFIVKSGNQEVEVLGTHFNINSYADEASQKTTLIEGSVKVSTGTLSKILIPGQQAALSRDGKMATATVDTETVIAWKNNQFLFDGENIQTLMRMVSRWYNVDIEYVGEVTNERFLGGVSKFDHVSKVLKSLESTGKVHFKIEGKKIYVYK